jgi:hypothetical protein
VEDHGRRNKISEMDRALEIIANSFKLTPSTNCVPSLLSSKKTRGRGERLNGSIWCNSYKAKEFAIFRI